MADTLTIFAQVAELLGNDVYQSINPVIASTLADIESNPGAWTNPLTAPLKGAAVVASLMGAVPNLEASAVHDVVTLVGALWTHIGVDLAKVPTTAAIAAEINPTPGV